MSPSRRAVIGGGAALLLAGGARAAPIARVEAPSGTFVGSAERGVLAFRGIRYGTLMTEHFGISSEIDLDSTEKLLHLRHLASLSNLTAEQQGRFDDLAEELTGRSRTLAVEVWMIRARLGEPLDLAVAEKQ